MSGAIFADAGSLFGAGASVKKTQQLTAACRCRSIHDRAVPTWHLPRRHQRRTCLGGLRRAVELPARAAASRYRLSAAQAVLRRRPDRAVRRIHALLDGQPSTGQAAPAMLVSATAAGEPIGRSRSADGGWMEHPGFFDRAAPIRLADLAHKVGAQLATGADADAPIHDVKALADAGVGEISFLDNRKYLGQLAATAASACLVAPAFAERVPPARRRPGDAAALSRVRARPAVFLPRCHGPQGGDDGRGRGGGASDGPPGGGRADRAWSHRSAARP